MHDLTQVFTRLERLERENRRWKRAGALVALGFVAAIVASFATPQDKVLRGEKLELTTQAGEVYAQIVLDGKGFPLLLLKKDKAHALLTLDKPAMHIRDEDGRRGAFVGFDTRGFGKVELAGKNLHDGVRMQMRPDGSAGVYVLDDEGYDRATLEYAGNDLTSITLREGKGRIRSSLAVDASGNSSAILLDSTGRRRVGMVVGTDGTPLISLEDERTVPRVNLTMDFDGAPKLEFLRADGAVSEKLP